MTHDQIERCNALWRELLAAERVRWMSGMLARADGWEPLRLAVESLPRVWSGIVGDAVGHEHRHDVCGGSRPVWTDPATLGCLVALAREAARDPEATCVVYNGRWHCDWHGNESIAETEPEALLLAIQAATT